MKRIFTVYDSKAEAFLEPFFAETAGLAIRSFETAANTSGHAFSKYAADFTLFEIGAFDQQICEFDIYPAQINLGTALTFQHQETNRLYTQELNDDAPTGANKAKEYFEKKGSNSSYDPNHGFPLETVK